MILRVLGVFWGGGLISCTSSPPFKYWYLYILLLSVCTGLNVGEDLVLLSQFTQVVYTMQLTDVRAFMLMIHFKEYSTNMFLCVQVSMIDQRHAICVQACTKRAFTYCVCTVYTERGCTMVYICLNMTRVNS